MSTPNRTIKPSRACAKAMWLKPKTEAREDDCARRFPLSFTLLCGVELASAVSLKWTQNWDIFNFYFAQPQRRVSRLFVQRA